MYGYSLDITKLHKGMIVKGIVSEFKKGKAIVKLQKCKYTASLAKADHEISEEDQVNNKYFEVLLQKGSEVTAVIKNIKLEP